MATWILEGTCDHGPAACLVDSVTGQAFGPLFSDREEADEFLTYANEHHGDVRGLVDVAGRVAEWRTARART